MAVELPQRPEDVAASFCAALVDEWARSGVTEAVVCPGSRSTPMALALAEHPGLRVHVHHDERSAAFTALGLALGSGRPAVVLTTSGTAAAELHPAVVEAYHARVPLVAVTADRPPEAHDVGAPQTIDQTHLFGPAVRWFVDPGVPDLAAVATWRPLAARIAQRAAGPPAGPVHLNLPFREPLLGVPARVPAGREDGAPWHRRHRPGWSHAGPAPDGLLDEVAGLLRGRGVVIAGRGAVGAAPWLGDLAARLGWPLLADSRSGCAGPQSVRAGDALVRSGAFPSPDVVLRVGEPPASKAVAQWSAGAGEVVVVDPDGRWDDPAGVVGTVVHADAGATVAGLVARLAQVPPDPWGATWLAAERAAQAAIDDVLAGHPEPTEPGTARAVAAAVPRGGVLVASSSMPVRDVEWYGLVGPGVAVVANRGANGIDGVTSTAVGVALAVHEPVVAVVGDVAFLHDTNGLLGLARRGVDLTVVVVDNDGGGIFSFLPQAEALEPARFEALFGTPHGVDCGAVAEAHGIAVDRPGTAAEVASAVRRAVRSGGPRAVHVRTDRRANRAVHDEIHAAVAAAVSSLG